MEEHFFTTLSNLIITAIVVLTFFYLFIFLPKRTRAAKKATETSAEKGVVDNLKQAYAAEPIARVIFFCVIVLFVTLLTKGKSLLSAVPVTYIQIASVLLPLTLIGWRTIKDLITSIKSTPLNEKEHYIILALAVTYLCLAPQLTIDTLDALLSNTTFAAFLCVFRLFLFFSSSFFLVVAMLLILLNKVVQVAKRDDFSKKIEKTIAYWMKAQMEALRKPELCCTLQSGNSKGLFFRPSSGLKSVGMFLVNAICFLCRVFFIALSSIFIFVFLFVLSTFDSVVKSFKKIPIRKTIVLSLRLAIVFGVTAVVAILHIYYFSEETRALISIVEFIASVIVIPVVFQWIQSYYENKRAEERKNMCTEKCCCKERTASPAPDATHNTTA